MSITVQCGQCQKMYATDERLAGRRVRCKNCGAMIDVPSTGPSSDIDDILGLGDKAGSTAGIRAVGGGAPRTAIDESSETKADMAAIAEAAGEMPSGAGDTGSGEIPFSAPAFDDSYKHARKFYFSGADEIDKYLPPVLAVAGLGWVIIQNLRVTHSGHTWLNLLSLFLVVIIYPALVFPLGLAALRFASRKMHFPLPPPVGMRAFGSFALPYALTYVLWTVAGDVGGLISGLILGLVLAGAIIWVLFHPEQREAPVTFGAVTAGYVGAVLVGGFILWGANVLIFNILNEKQQAHTVPTSPFGPTFAWDAPEPDEPKTPTAPPRTPPRPSVAGTDLNAPQVSPPEVVGPSAVPPVAPPGPTPSTTAPSHVAVVETPETTPDESPFTATTKPVDAQGGTVKASVVDASQATPEAAPKGTTPVTVFDPEVEPNATSVPRDPESVVVEVVQSKLGVFDRIIYPFDDSGKWMAVVRRLGAGEDAVERWQLSPVMEKQGEVRFRHEPHVQDRYILSPNGDHLVRIVNWPRLSAQVWSFEAARVSRNIELDEKFGSPELVDFVGEDEFAIHWERGPTHGLEMWNARTFQRGKQVAVTAFDNSPGNLAISPEGRFIAMAAKGAGEAQLQIYDRVTTKALKRLPVISLDRRWPVRPSGLEFSPDGSKIAALFEQNNNGLIVCWKIADGRIVAEHIYPAGVLPDGGGAPQHGNDGGGGEVMIGNRNVATFVGHSGRAFEWLSSGDAWLLYGRGLFDADSGRQLDDLGIERAVGQRVVGKDTIHIMQSAGPAPGGAAGSGGFGARTATLAIVKLDLQRLTAKQQAAAGDDALPAPGPRPVRRNPGPPANGG